MQGTHFISSMPLHLALTHMTPPPPDYILDAARNLWDGIGVDYP
jgi:hypothetical protein